MVDTDRIEGLVVRIQGRDYVVMADGQEIRCSLRGKFRLGESPEEVLPVVGDSVSVRRERSTEARSPAGLITAVAPRRSIFARTDPAGRRRYAVLGANMDIAVLVFAARSPDLNRRLLDRMLVAAEWARIEPVICLNKMDLTERPAEMERTLDVYAALSYRVVFTSAKEGTGIEQLAAFMRGRISLFAGPSGAGKTSLIAAIQPGLELRIASVSERTGKGRHTTTHFELHALAGGGYLADSPGIREFGVWGVTPPELGEYFREFAPCLGGCRFSTCTHSHEPACAVKDAVASGTIDADRYESYLRILETLPKTRAGG